MSERLLQRLNKCTMSIGSTRTHRGFPVANKLGIGDTFPRLTLTLVDGNTLELPDGVDAKYRILLFYRGHW